MTVRIDIDAMRAICRQVGDPAWHAEVWAPTWARLQPAERAQVLDAYLSRYGAVTIGPADPASIEAPTLMWPPGHWCRSGEGTGGGATDWAGPDEGDRARAAAALLTGTGASPIGTGLLSRLGPDWWKWLAWAAVAVGVVVLIRRNRK